MFGTGTNDWIARGLGTGTRPLVDMLFMCETKIRTRIWPWDFHVRSKPFQQKMTMRKTSMTLYNGYRSWIITILTHWRANTLELPQLKYPGERPTITRLDYWQRKRPWTVAQPAMKCTSRKCTAISCWCPNETRRNTTIYSSWKTTTCTKCDRRLGRCVFYSHFVPLFHSPFLVPRAQP